MSVIELNLRQKKLLQQLAELKKSNQLTEPFTPFPVDLMNYVVYLRSRYNLRIQWISDLEALCLAGYLTYEWNRMLTSKKFCVSKLGMSILSDETFITKDDYRREHPSLSGFDLFVDSNTQPPSSDSFNLLLAADLEKVSLALKESLTECLQGEELGSAVAELNFVISAVVSPDPDQAEVAKSVRNIGNIILEQVGRDTSESHLLSDAASQDSCHALMVFGLWNKQVVKQLMA